MEQEEACSGGFEFLADHVAEKHNGLPYVRSYSHAISRNGT
jgi:hypothetical protein